MDPNLSEIPNFIPANQNLFNPDLQNLSNNNQKMEIEINLVDETDNAEDLSKSKKAESNSKKSFKYFSSPQTQFSI